MPRTRKTQQGRSGQPRRAHQADDCARVLGLDLTLLLLAAGQDVLLKQRLLRVRVRVRVRVSQDVLLKQRLP